MAPTEHDHTAESTFYEMDDKMNMTAPPDLLSFGMMLALDGDGVLNRFKTPEVHPTPPRSDELDPCILADDEREMLMRKRRKEDAYKTALCDSYRRNGRCDYGEECRFAHGVAELRLPTQPRGRNHPKYKTVLCEKFTKDGFCKYGARCQFIHKSREEHGQAAPVNMQCMPSRGMAPIPGFVAKPKTHDDHFAAGLFGRNGGFDLNQSLPHDARSDFGRSYPRAFGDKTVQDLWKSSKPSVWSSFGSGKL